MTRRIHCYRKEWSTALHPEYDVMYFNANTLKLYKHLFQTGVMSAVRKTQHQFSKSTTTTKKKSVTHNNCERSNTSTRSLGGDLRKYSNPVSTTNSNSINNIHNRTLRTRRSQNY